MPPEGREEKSMEAAVAMAKKKTVTPRAIDPGDELREELLAVRCKPSFKRWVERFAKSERMTPSQLVDRGLALLAKSTGFETPPER
jgi:hypothetical protein